MSDTPVFPKDITKVPIRIGLITLPIDHPNRNRSLLGCSYTSPAGLSWKVIKPEYRIANKTFNELGPAWTETTIFDWREDQEEKAP